MYRGGLNFRSQIWVGDQNLLAHAVDVLVTDVLPQHPPTRVLLSTLLADEAAAVPSGFCRGPGGVILPLTLDIN